MTVQKGGWDYFQDGKAAMGDASGNAVTDSSGNPAANTLIANTSLLTYITATGGESSFAADNPDTIVLGDLTAFGIPFASLKFTKTNTGTADLTYCVVDGTLVFQISNTAGTISVTLSATTTAGDVFDGPLSYTTSGGTVQTTAIAADGVFYLFLGK